jgi:hypothetical protein
MTEHTEDTEGTVQESVWYPEGRVETITNYRVGKIADLVGLKDFHEHVDVEVVTVDGRCYLKFPDGRFSAPIEQTMYQGERRADLEGFVAVGILTPAHLEQMVAESKAIEERNRLVEIQRAKERFVENIRSRQMEALWTEHQGLVSSFCDTLGTVDVTKYQEISRRIGSIQAELKVVEQATIEGLLTPEQLIEYNAIGAEEVIEVPDPQIEE